MAMTLDEATFVSDLRLRILNNQRLGLPAEAGLTKDELKQAIALCRKDYQAAQGKSKASGVSNPSLGPKIDLAAIFSTKKS